MITPCYETFGNGVQYIFFDEPMEHLTFYRKFSEDRKVLATSTISGPHKVENETHIEEELDRLLSEFDRGEGNGN